ncbi:pyruvate:ferredoxin (flavodoxin) oxidoreductase [Vagococcus sp. CY53-2]|uniref:pyruvate:ferredoxin (flavodoxin) oxidoreductase n=1 Tax=Vagococcus sp. CY53-2 TaxID=2925780 RepID=UPI001F508632|nr:pyruvate:ferredoxin (flavodoxin) oxidoreductase [Vagococcus sp. CY53-2]MCI0130281.1 pyruvate:ferredoxin (flavodoxin) oxidoreductase [Vagococcus sp. CY53-2]
MTEKITMDGNTAAAYVSYAFTELVAVYPITPSSTMAEVVENWSVKHRKNIFGEPVKVVNMQSEAGAAGAVHGSLKAGTLTSTYTASQGLLLMIPNMYKIAGELLPTVFHVASRAVTTNALSIFGDHGDVMAARQTGFCMLAESSVQEVMDLSAVAHLASIEASLPFMNFFDGFRTSHEIQKIDVIPYDVLGNLVNQEALDAFRKRAMNPNHPSVSGTAQNPDIHFQQRETINQYYERVPEIVQKYMNDINAIRGTNYDLSTYYGHEEATEIIISMGSVAPTVRQTVDYLNNQGRKVGHLNIHLYRPFPTENILKNIPDTVERIAVLDRTKEPGADGEPLLLDIQSAMYRHKNRPIVIGGRYGLGSKDVPPNQIKAIFDHLSGPVDKLLYRFTVGINDDVTHLSLPVGPLLDLTPKNTYQAKFWGFGSDGTVGANKQAIKIIGNHTDLYAQGYFSYDSKKSGGLTTSYLRFGKEPINSPYLIETADFIGCHNGSYIHQYDLLRGLKKGGTFLLNTTWDKDRVLRLLPKRLKKELAKKEANFYIIDAMSIAQEVGLGRRINQVMSTAFFELNQLMPKDEYIKYLKEEVVASYGKKSQAIVDKNHAAIDLTLSDLVKVDIPSDWLDIEIDKAVVDMTKPKYVREILEPVNAQQGDSLSVKTLIDNNMTDGSVPMGTAAFEKRGIALEVPEWIPEACTMCNECAFICPHAAIRPFLADDEEMAEAPEGFIVREMKGADGLKYRIQVSLEDCTGCGLCVDVCPAKEKALVMKPYDEQKEEAINWAFAMTLKQKANPVKKKESIKGSQFEQPLMEFSGACSGCGETTYIKLLTQLYGDRMLMANATGCSSIWGASAPSTPYTTNSEGQGPAWSNSLFEDNAEFGLGMYLANKTQRDGVQHLLEEAIEQQVGTDSLRELMADWIEHKDEGKGSRQRSTKLEAALLEEMDGNELLEDIYRKRDLFVKPSQWIIGGDGWAYDIGFGGIDHCLASGEDVNIFIMDNEVYSNTGGQTSKATPTGAIAKFSSEGKRTPKKDLGLIAMTYGGVYVAQIAINANPTQAIKAIAEAENYPGPSLIIGYVPCINHGIQGGMSHAVEVTKRAVESGYWPLYRYNPELVDKGKEPLKIDYKKANFDNLTEFFNYQTRFSALENVLEDEAEVATLLEKSADDAIEKAQTYKKLSGK